MSWIPALSNLLVLPQSLKCLPTASNGLKVVLLVKPESAIPNATIIAGPVWVQDWPTQGSGGKLLFSDVKANRMYQWSDADGLSVFQENSGCWC